ncbi:MAG: hypothetical protein ACFFDW_12800 [Candidatus Thorarchaeota archaeon]
MSRFGNFIGWLFFFAMQAAYDTFVIWGLATYGVADSFVSDTTTLILLAVPTLLVINAILMIPVAIFGFSIFKKKETKPEYGLGKRFSGMFQKDRNEEDIERWFKENITEEKVERWFKEKFNKEE